MKILRVLLALSPLLFGGWDHGAAVIPKYYWAASGNDANNCLSPATACQTITNFASFPFVAGDVVAFNGGDTFVGGLTITADNMTITTYGSGQPTISSGNSKACVTATNHSGIIINNIICTGGGVTTNTTHGISISNTTSSTVFTGPTITSSTVTGYGGDCIFIGAAGNDPNTNGFSNITISGNITHDCTGNFVPGSFEASACIYIGASNLTAFSESQTRFSNVTVKGNTVYNCTGTSGIISGGAPTGDGISVTNITTALISNNLIHDGGANSDTVAGPVAIIFAWVNGGIIQFNETYNWSSAGGDGEGIDFDSGVTNSIMQYNYIHDNKFAGVLVGDFSRPPANNNNIIRFNIIQSGNHNEQGIEVQPGPSLTKNLQIYNNTIVNEGGGGCLTTTQPTNDTIFTINFSNNLCFGDANEAGWNVNLADNNGAVFTATGNSYFSFNATPVGWGVKINGVTNNYNTLAALQAAGYEKVGGTPVGNTSNPNLTGSFSIPATVCGTATTVGWNASCPNNYKLTSSSPNGKGNGLNLFLIYLFGVGIQDFYGNTVSVNNLPIGAAANQ